jgi:hypothetical protein
VANLGVETWALKLPSPEATDKIAFQMVPLERMAWIKCHDGSGLRWT